MLKAYDVKNKKYFNSLSNDDGYIRYIKDLCKINRLFCPYCEHTNECDGVIYVKKHFRMDSKVKPYFRRPYLCEYAETLPQPTEGQHNESVEHIDLKVRVGSYFKRQGYEVDYEVRIGNHIVDVTAVKDNQRIAIECQLSSITTDVILDRDSTYEQCGYQCIWVSTFSSSLHVGEHVNLSSAQKNIYCVSILCALGEHCINELIFDTPRSRWAKVAGINKVIKETKETVHIKDGVYDAVLTSVMKTVTKSKNRDSLVIPHVINMLEWNFVVSDEQDIEIQTSTFFELSKFELQLCSYFKLFKIHKWVEKLIGSKRDSNGWIPMTSFFTIQTHLQSLADKRCRIVIENSEVTTLFKSEKTEFEKQEDLDRCRVEQVQEITRCQEKLERRWIEEEELETHRMQQKELENRLVAQERLSAERCAERYTERDKLMNGANPNRFAEQERLRKKDIARDIWNAEHIADLVERERLNKLHLMKRNELEYNLVDPEV